MENTEKGSGGHRDAASEPVRRIPARVPAHVDGVAPLRDVARAITNTGVGAVVVDNNLGPLGFVTARDLVEAIADGADPDICWAGAIMRPVLRMVSREQNPVAVGEEMAACELEVVTVVDENSRLGVASALDILRSVVRVVRETQAHHDR